MTIGMAFGMATARPEAFPDLENVSKWHPGQMAK
ncbi:MAG: hypothetical protein QOF88_6535, partial [Mycobacterium sp.]|nr:hypothetical protein [Mycobacterium sp.]